MRKTIVVFFAPIITLMVAVITIAEWHDGAKFLDALSSGLMIVSASVVLTALSIAWAKFCADKFDE